MFDYADLAYPAAASHFETTLFGRALLCVPRASSSFGSGEKALKLLGGLGPDRRNLMIGGTVYMFSQLPPDVRGILTHLVSSSNGTEFYRNDNRPHSDPIPNVIALAPLVRSETLPNGIPGSARLSLKRNAREIVECRDPANGSFTEEPLLYFAARIVKRKTNSDDPSRPFGQFRTVVGSTLTIRLDIEPGLYYTGTMSEVQRMSPWVDQPNKIPSDVWQRVEILVRDLEQGKIKPPAISKIG